MKVQIEQPSCLFLNPTTYGKYVTSGRCSSWQGVVLGEETAHFLSTSRKVQ